MIDLKEYKEKYENFYQDSLLEIIDRAIIAESKLAEIEKQEPVAHRWVDINRDGEPYYEYEDGEPFVGKEIDCQYKYRRLYEMPVHQSPRPKVPDGWKLVPIIPTPEMIASLKPVSFGATSSISARYTELVLAAPEPQIKR